MKTEYLGYDIEIDNDEFAESPRTYTNIGYMLCNHRGYNLGDEKLPYNGNSFWEDFLIYIDNEHAIVDNSPDEFTDKDIKEIEQWIGNNIMYYTLSLYDHGSISMSIGEPTDNFDSGQVGYIYCTKQDIRDWNNIKSVHTSHIEDAKRLLREEVKSYNKYLNNDTYRFRINLLDENSGGYESEEEALTEAKEMIESYDPECKIMNLAGGIYEESLHEFWDKFNELKNDNEITGGDEDLLTNIVGEKLRNY